MFRHNLRSFITAVVVPLLATTALAYTPQNLTLEQAIAIALEKNPVRKAALAEQKAAAATTREARSLLLPRIVFAETATRGNDPVYAFGTRLRQHSFTEADFAVNRLNTPAPISDFSSRFTGQWSVFDSMQSWVGLNRAKLMQKAAVHQVDRTDQQLIFRVVHGYYGVLVAGRQLQAAEAALKTAQSIEERSRSRVESGVAVSADLLSAQVLVAERQQQAIRARNRLSLAHTELALAVGMPADSKFEPVDVLAERDFPILPLSDLEHVALERRPDLKRLLTEESAQSRAVTMAKAAFAPRMNVFGSWQTNSAGGNNWTAGAELQLDLFDGGAKAARLVREKAVQERTAAMREAFKDNIRLEVRSAYYDLDAARQQVDLARAAVSQAKESIRIMQNRYDSGLCTLTDLLRVEDAARRAQSDYWEAVYRLHTSYANLELATGTLSANSQVVKQ